MNYQIIDNFLSDEEFNRFNVMFTLEFPWYYSDVVVYGSNTELGVHDFQLIHSFYRDYGFNSGYASLVAPLLQKLDPYAILKIKAKLISGTDKKLTHGYHVDIQNYSQDTKTAVYYINTNNGTTVLKQGNDAVEIESVANRIVIFDTSILHSGSTCTDKKVRCVINLNFIKKS